MSIPAGTKAGMVVHVLGPLPYDKYVGRRNGHYGLKESLWANPFRLKRGAPESDRRKVLEAFERHARTIYSPTPGTEGFLPDLRGLTLACWCAPRDGYLTLEDQEVCHAQVLLRLAWEFGKRHELPGDLARESQELGLYEGDA
jgi:hypothetical protein